MAVERVIALETPTVERPTGEQWVRVRDRLRAELGEDVFSSWFGRVEFEQADMNSVYLSVPTRFLKSWIASHYGDRLLALWNVEVKSIVRIELIVRGATRARPVQPEKDMPVASVTQLPMTHGKSSARCSTALSWMLLWWPTTMRLMSPRSTA